MERDLVGLNGEEPRSRAISSSARPLLILGLSASDVSRRAFWLGRMAEDSRDEMYPLSSMEANLRLVERVMDEA